MGYLLNIFNFLKGKIVLFFSFTTGILLLIIANLRRQKAETKADLAEGEVEALRRAEQAIKEGAEKSDELVEKARERAKHHKRNDIK